MQRRAGAFAQYAVTFGGGLLDMQAYSASQCPVASPVTECLTDGHRQLSPTGRG